MTKRKRGGVKRRSVGAWGGICSKGKMCLVRIHRQNVSNDFSFAAGEHELERIVPVVISWAEPRKPLGKVKGCK